MKIMAARNRSTSKDIKKRPRATGAAPKVIMPANVRWLAPLGLYPRKRALTFETLQDLHRVIDATWNPEDELYRMPHHPAGNLTMIVPEEAVPFFRARPLRFREYPVVPMVRRSRRADGPDAS